MSFQNAMAPLNEGSARNLDSFETYDFAQLGAAKKQIEAELDSLFGQLQQLGADMDTPLVTADGFPRNDLDVVQTRLVRVKVIRARNDHKRVLALLDRRMAEQFDLLSRGKIDRAKEDLAQLIPFATIDEVNAGSPAEQAGLQVGDRVLRFSTVNVTNHGGLANIVPVVKNNVGRPVEIVVSRGNQRTLLELVPMQWSGRGLLGCKLVEIK